MQSSGDSPVNIFRYEEEMRMNRNVRLPSLLFVVVTVFGMILSGATLNAAQEVPKEPLAGEWWKGTVSPKQRAIISFMDDNGAIKTFRGQGPDTTNPLPRLNESVTSAGDIGTVFSMGSTAGFILSKKIISPGLYGQKEFKDIPSGVLCNMYLTGNERNSVVWLELTGKNGRIVRVKMPNIPTPAYKCMFKDSGGWFTTEWKEARPLDENVAHSIIGADWNNDGYTDYVFCYVHNPVDWSSKDVNTEIVVA